MVLYICFYVGRFYIIFRYSVCIRVLEVVGNMEVVIFCVMGIGESGVGVRVISFGRDVIRYKYF